MSLLFLTMITNAMWFKGESNNENVEAIKLGPISFTVAQVSGEHGYFHLLLLIVIIIIIECALSF